VKPLAINLEPDGTGSAAFAWDQALPLVSETFRTELDSVVRAAVTLIGIRFVDRDGRDTPGPRARGDRARRLHDQGGLITLETKEPHMFKLAKLAIVPAVVGLAIGGTLMGMAAASPSGSPQVIRLTAVNGRTQVHTSGPGGRPVPGDYLVFSQSLYYDAAMHHPAGTAFIQCVLEFTRQNTTCTANATLTGRGSLVVEGRGTAATTGSLAIVGGTGEFRDATGQADLTGLNHRVQTVVLNLDS
jgi:hypothetical protein